MHYAWFVIDNTNGDAYYVWSGLKWNLKSGRMVWMIWELLIVLDWIGRRLPQIFKIDLRLCHLVHEKYSALASRQRATIPENGRSDLLGIVNAHDRGREYLNGRNGLIRFRPLEYSWCLPIKDSNEADDLMEFVTNRVSIMP
jgi:hypothetical protein